MEYHHNYLSSISGVETTALKDTWIIGDNYLGEIFHALPGLKTQAISQKNEIPYIYRYYNVRCFTANPLSHIRDTLTRITNSLIKALNDNQHIPRFIIIIPNQDILWHVMKYDAGITLPCNIAIEWITKQMTRAISSKEDILYRKKPGAIAPFEPKFIWVTAMKNDRSNTATKKFNKLLNSNLQSKANHYIIDVCKIMDDQKYFSNGMLNGQGKVKFWIEIDTHIENFDNRKMSLHPQNYTREQTNSSRADSLPTYTHSDTDSNGEVKSRQQRHYGFSTKQFHYVKLPRPSG